MRDLWFLMLAALLAAYVVMDGFDLGAGAIHRVVARDDRERRSVIAAIGPFWDGNEVLLLAAGGTLFTAFSRVLAAALSGLYLAVVLVLWTLILRGVSLEVRSHLADGLWRSFWDTLFQATSGLLALLLGVALGNVLRGFPLQADGYFELELFSTDSPSLARGTVDGYTVVVGLLAVLVLVVHGARFLAMRTEGDLQRRSLAVAERVTPAMIVAWAAASGLTTRYAAPAWETFQSRPLAWTLLATAGGALSASWTLGRRGRPRGAFLASAGFVLSLIGLAAASVYPVLLRSTTPGVPSMTVESAANAPVTLAAGLRWWFFAATLVVLYFANLFRMHRGVAAPYGEGGEEDVADPEEAPSRERATLP